MPTEITVRGTFSAFEAPERGTVHASIAYDGPAMEPVYEGVASDLDNAKESIVTLRDLNAVTWWSADQLRTWSTRPWNQEGKQLPLVHHASVGLEVKFRDFVALSRWVGERIAGTEGFRVSRVEWTLTSARHDELHRHARARAVQDAVTRAQQYADAAGLGTVRPLAIADAGMLGAAPERRAESAYLRAATAGGTPEVELEPEHIEVSAQVDARFVVVDGAGA